MRLDPKSFVHVVIESCIASSVGNGKSLKYAVVVAGNMASYKVTNNEDILYEGLSSEQAAEVFNAFEEKRPRKNVRAVQKQNCRNYNAAWRRRCSTKSVSPPSRPQA
jgi:hypothetical protein